MTILVFAIAVSAFYALWCVVARDKGETILQAAWLGALVGLGLVVMALMMQAAGCKPGTDTDKWTL
jgi:hypothetical protein